MLKRVLCLLVVAVLIFSAVAGCGSGKRADKTSTAFKSEPAADYSGVENNDSYGAADAGAAEADNSVAADEMQKEDANESPKSISGVGQSASSLSNAILSERKLIRSANVSVEVDDFEKAYGQLKTLINAIGFVQESNIRKDKRYVDSKEVLITKAVIVLRVDKDKFEQVVDGISGLGTLIDQSIQGEDVTEKYFDKESRLRLLRFEESRIEEYLRKLTNLDEIFRAERQLTDIRYEIESLTGTLKKWDNLVELSTITVNMNEKEPVASPAEKKEKTYLTKLKEQFLGSFKGVISFLGDVVLFLVGIFPALLLLTLLGFIAYKIYGRFFKKVDKALKNSDNDNSSNE